MDHNEERVKLIRAVQEVGKHWESYASSQAVESARYPEDAKRRADAQRAVAVADAVQKAREDIICLINAHWPAK